LAACAGQKLEEIVDADAWTRAAARYARLQADCVPHVPALRALGCPVHDLDTLARRIEPLCNDAAALRAGQPDGLTAGEVERLRRLVPTLRRHCEQLAAVGIALTLEHGDLWPGNLFVDADHCAIIDWEDVIIAHPFFSLAPLSVGLRGSPAYSPELLMRVEAAYLAAFAGAASKARLRSALRLAAPLGFIDMAIRYRHQRPSVVALHPWMRDLVPETLRLALASVDTASE
jgi:Ser/Thr protein kinase RdoA (MazF antagonist)